MINRSKQISLLFLLIAASVIAAYYVREYIPNFGEHNTANSTTSNTPSPHSNQPPRRPAFRLPDLDGELQSIENWDGQVIMVNFWATWCPPCRREMPAFVRLYEDYRDKGFVVIGIAIDDPQSVRDFVDPMDINYPILLGEKTGIDITTAYGNRLGALPFTVIIDRQGHIIHTRRRELTYEEAETLIKPLL